MPSPASATSTTSVGFEGADEVDAVTVGRDGGADAARGLDEQRPCVGAMLARTSSARSAIVNGGSPSASAAIGGAIGSGSQRCARAHRRSGRRPSRAASTSASVAVSPGANDCTGLRADDRRARGPQTFAASAAGDERLADVGAGAGDGDDASPSLDGNGAEHVGERAQQVIDLRVGVRGRDRDPEPRRARRERSAGGSRERGARRRAARPRRRARAARRRRRTGRSATDDRAAAGRRARAAARRSAAPSGDRTTRSAASAAAASAGVGAVVKMYGRARFSTSSIERAGPATKPPSAPSVFDSVPTRSTSASVGERRARGRAPRALRRRRAARLRARTGRRVAAGRRRRRPSRTRCRSRRARGGRRGRGGARRGGRGRGGGTRRRRRGRAGSRR